MSTLMKNGKRPVSQKSRPARISSDDIFDNQLALHPDMAKAIEAKGYVYRFINAIQYRHFGKHPAHWTPVHTKQLKEWGYDTVDTHALMAGSAPDGFTYRGADLILAIRPKGINDRHKAFLKQEAGDRVVSNSKDAEALREFSRANGVDAHVSEGYDDEAEE